MNVLVVFGSTDGQTARVEMGSVDASHDTVFTDWQQVRLFALAFSRQIEDGRQAVAAPPEEARPSA